MKVKNLIFVDADDIQTFIAGKIFGSIPEIEAYKSFSSGWDALDYLNVTGSTFNPDVIFVDLKMPEMNGFEFIENYQERFNSKYPDSKIIILTSSILYNDQQKAKSYEIVHKFLNKPLTKEKIKELMET